MEIPKTHNANAWSTYFAIKRDELLLENYQLQKEVKRLNKIIDKLLK